VQGRANRDAGDAGGAAVFSPQRCWKKARNLNAVGAIAPDREEFAQDVFARATIVAVDNLPGVQQLSREFMTR